MKKFLDSDWLRAVQFLGNSVPKKEIQCQKKKFSANFFRCSCFVIGWDYKEIICSKIWNLKVFRRLWRSGRSRAAKSFVGYISRRNNQGGETSVSMSVSSTTFSQIPSSQSPNMKNCFLNCNVTFNVYNRNHKTSPVINPLKRQLHGLRLRHTQTIRVLFSKSLLTV